MSREKINVSDNYTLSREDSVVSLRLFEERDIPQKVVWINNPENNQHLHYNIPINYEDTRKWFFNKNNSVRMDYVIEYDGVPVGLIGLLSIDHFHHKAELYISMGEVIYKKRGISTVAIQILLGYGFQHLHLHKIYSTTDGENHAVHRLLEKVGFVQEGYFKDDMIHRGRYIDRIRYSVFSDWQDI